MGKLTTDDWETVADYVEIATDAIQEASDTATGMKAPGWLVKGLDRLEGKAADLLEKCPSRTG